MIFNPLIVLTSEEQCKIICMHFLFSLCSKKQLSFDKSDNTLFFAIISLYKMVELVMNWWWKYIPGNLNVQSAQISIF